jgi:AcrR family transcriptional regulator
MPIFTCSNDGKVMKRSRRKPKRTQLERRSETQAAILSAAISLLAERGFAGFSASGVAAHAGISRGAQEHYFPKRTDLIAAATQYAMREAVEHARLLARTAGDSTDPIAKFLNDSEHFFFQPVYRAMIEIMIAARSDRALARILNPIVLEARQTLNGIWIDTLGAAGYPRDKVERFIELTHHLLRGVFLADTWLPYRIDRSAIVEAWHQLAPAVLEPKQPAPPPASAVAPPPTRGRTGSWPSKNQQRSW